MPSSHSVEHSTESKGAVSDVRPAVLAPADLQKILRGVAGVLADADESHGHALEELHGRLESLGRAASAARDKVPEEFAAAFERIEGGLGMLADRIAQAKTERKDGVVAARSEATAAAEPAAALAATGAPADQTVSPPATANSASGQAADAAPAPLRSALSGSAGSLGRSKLSPSVIDPFDVVDSTRMGDVDAPWDEPSAEALTRVYEDSGLTLKPAPTMAAVQAAVPAVMAVATTIAADAPKSDAAVVSTAAAAPLAMLGSSVAVLAQPSSEASLEPTSAPAPAAQIERDWLEARFAEIAVRIEQSLAEIRPDSSLTALDTRLEQFETRFGQVLDGVATRSDLEDLRQVETHISEIANHVESAQLQLQRLDTIEAQLNAVMEKLSDQRLSSFFEEANSRDIDVQSIARLAAEQVATRLAEVKTQHGDGSDEARRIEELRSLLNSFMAERRQGEEQTTSMLDTMQQAMIRLLDRVDSLEMAPHDAVADPYAAYDSAAVSAAYEPAPVVAEPKRFAAPEETKVSAAAAAAMSSTSAKVKAAAAAAFEDVPLAPHERALGHDAETPSQNRDQLIADARRAMVAAARQQQEEQAKAEAAGKKNGKAKKADAKALAETPGGLKSSTRRILVGACTLLLLSSAVLLMIPRKQATNIPPPKGVERTTTGKDVGSPGATKSQPAAPAAGDVKRIDKGADAGQLGGEGEARVAHVSAEPSDFSSTPLPGIVVHQNGDMTPADFARVQEQRTMAETSTRLGSGATAGEIDAAMATARPIKIAADATGPRPVPVQSAVVEAQASVAGAGASRVRLQDLPPAGVGPLSLRMAAAGGDASAEFEVAARYAEGKGVQQDFPQAVVWYERAASRGLSVAQYRLGTLYERGLGVKADSAKARAWYARAAETGNIKAMHNLAVLSASRERAAPDYTTAAHWFQQAADRGLADSQYNIAVLYETGLGVSRDMAQAYKWFTIASRAGDKESKRRLELVKMKLDAAEIAGADRFVAQWRPQASERIANDPFAAGQAWKTRREGAQS